MYIIVAFGCCLSRNAFNVTSHAQKTRLLVPLAKRKLNIGQGAVAAFCGWRGTGHGVSDSVAQNYGLSGLKRKTNTPYLYSPQRSMPLSLVKAALQITRDVLPVVAVGVNSSNGL